MQRALPPRRLLLRRAGSITGTSWNGRWCATGATSPSGSAAARILSAGKEKPIDLQYGSLGGHVLITEDLELGLRVGWGLNDSSPNVFSNLGLGMRF